MPEAYKEGKIHVAMRKVLLMAVLAVMCMGISAQTVRKDSTGIYTSVSKIKVPDKLTGDYYKDSKGVKYPVYVSANGKLYIIRVSKKSGNEYKSYLKLEQ
jgi:hypothetical protein